MRSLKQVLALFVAVGLVAPMLGQASAGESWSAWQTSQMIAMRVRCAVDPVNAKHSILSVQIQNTGTDRMYVKGQGTKKDGLGDPIAPGHTLEISLEQSSDCSKDPHIKLSAKTFHDPDDSDDPDDSGISDYRIEYKQAKLQVNYHVSNLALVNAALQGVAAGMNGGH